MTSIGKAGALDRRALLHQALQSALPRGWTALGSMIAISGSATR